MAYRTAIYAGSFDPITKGHIWVIEQGLRLFDHLYIAIGKNPSKKSFFSLDDRVDMINEYLDKSNNTHHAEILVFDTKFLVDVARKRSIPVMLRGIRNVTDFAYEMEIKQFNDSLAPDIETVFVAPPLSLIGASSSIVRGCVGLDNWEQVLTGYTTDYVINKFKNRAQHPN
jgi:pantetheine-phosphate adenylyltransferase